MDVQLILLQGGRRTRAIRLKSPEVVLGRRRGCDVRVAAREISRQHCRIRMHGNRITVADLGSANGTYVNGQLVTDESVVCSGDQLRVGPVTFVLECGQFLGQLRADDATPVDQSEQSVITDGIEVVEGDGFEKPYKGIPLPTQPTAPVPLKAGPNSRRSSVHALPFAQPADDDIPFAEIAEEDVTPAELDENKT